MKQRIVPCLGAAWALAMLLQSIALAQETGDPARGQRLFLQCQACHSLQSTVAGTVGPALNGVVGRNSASLPGYGYSPALKSAGLVWDEATLDQWLEHPNALVPGTKMIFVGIGSRADRLSIIAYLKQTAAKPGTQ